ncbi:MAG: hypothetical protein C4589_09455 [Peptococcaceae bacterium]|nr:MAG: hypothetical protein C4589_09455 [Peptococcaceae bacterium]
MLLAKEEFRELFLEDLREKKKARPKQAIGKKRPRTIITPSDLKEKVPWWRAAPSILHVDITTGRVLVWLLD